MDDMSIEEMPGETPKGKGGRKPLTQIERDARNARIVRDRLRGQSWSHLSDKYELADGTLKDIYKAWAETNQGTYQGRDPIHLVHRMLDRYDAWIEQLAEIADDSEADSAKIAAINAQMGAMTRSAELMQATGILPHNLGTLRLEMDVRLLTGKLMNTLVEHGATIELKRAILEALQPNHDGLSVAQLPSTTG